MPDWANGISSSEWNRLPAGSMIVGVTKMTRFFLLVALDSLRNKGPRRGSPPSTGPLFLILVTSWVIGPPRTTVCPSQTRALGVTWRRRRGGGGIWPKFGRAAPPAPPLTD